MRSNHGFPTVVVVLILGILGPSPTGADHLLLSVSPGGGSRPPDSLLRKVDYTDGSTEAGSSVSITLDEAVVVGATGLARNPLDGVLYALLKVEGTSFRLLVTLDEITGIATGVGDDLGNTGKRFAGIAFASDGTLYAVTGDGGATPEELFILDTGDASSISVIALGAGSDGETLAFNPDDGLLYHASGIGTPNHPDGEIFETIDPDTDVVTNVTLSGFDYEELTALTFLDGGFFAGDLGDAAVDMPGFFRITPGGVVTFLGNMDHVSKGLVLADPTPTPTATPTPTPTTTPTATPTASPTPTPEPSVMLQLVAGGVGLALLNGRRMRMTRRPSRTNQSSSRVVGVEIGEE
jgi:hypothetical protein